MYIDIKYRFNLLQYFRSRKTRGKLRSIHSEVFLEISQKITGKHQSQSPQQSPGGVL